MTNSVAPAPAFPAKARSAEVDLRSNRPLLGAGLAVVATLFFASHDTISKYLLTSYDVPLVSAIRYIVQTLLMLAVLGPHQGHALVQTRRTGLVVVRSLCLVAATLLFGLALQVMPIAETTAIIYLAPILVVLLSRPLLGEVIGPLGWASAIGGFVGILLIVRPGSGLDPMGLIYALSNTIVMAGYYVLSRALAKSERTITLLFYSGLVGSICFGLATPWFWFGTMPSYVDLALFLSLGILAGVGHFCFTLANRFTQASLIAPITYAHLIWAGLLGWLVFGQLPDGTALSGMAIIVLAGFTTAVRSRPPAPVSSA